LLTSYSDAEIHKYDEKLLKSLDKILNNCLRYPSAKALDFGFLDQDIVKMACATTTTNDDKTRMNAASKEAIRVNSALNIGWTNIQMDILDIVAKLSKHSPKIIEQQTSFFRLGLDSISAAQIAAFLRLKGWNVSPVEVIEVPLCSVSKSN
jgi:ferricrocin synthase